MPRTIATLGQSIVSMMLVAGGLFVVLRDPATAGYFGGGALIVLGCATLPDVKS